MEYGVWSMEYGVWSRMEDLKDKRGDENVMD